MTGTAAAPQATTWQNRFAPQQTGVTGFGQWPNRVVHQPPDSNFGNYPWAVGLMVSALQSRGRAICLWAPTVIPVTGLLHPSGGQTVASAGFSHPSGFQSSWTAKIRFGSVRTGAASIASSRRCSESSISPKGPFNRSRNALMVACGLPTTVTVSTIGRRRQQQFTAPRTTFAAAEIAARSARRQSRKHLGRHPDSAGQRTAEPAAFRSRK